jgi:hypothetical protein
MIVLQSLRLAVALCRCLDSPKGCRRLAGDNIPGHQPNDLCALKGRWREPISLARSSARTKTWHSVFVSVIPCSFCQRLGAFTPLREKSVFIRLPRRSQAKAGVHPWLKPGLLAVQVSSIQGFPRLLKAIQAYSRVFGKKYFL